MTLPELLGREATAIAYVGAYDGRHSKYLRQEFPRAMLWLIDPWTVNNIYRTYDFDNSPEKWARVEAACRRRFRDDRNARCLKMTSADAVRGFQPASLDLVFLDAGREYSLLLGYVNSWLPKLKPGGVIAGKGLAGKMRGDVWLVLQDRFGGHERISRTTWAVKWR